MNEKGGKNDNIYYYMYGTCNMRGSNTWLYFGSWGSISRADCSTWRRITWMFAVYRYLPTYWLVV